MCKAFYFEWVVFSWTNIYYSLASVDTICFLKGHRLNCLCFVIFNEILSSFFYPTHDSQKYEFWLDTLGTV